MDASCKRSLSVFECVFVAHDIAGIDDVFDGSQWQIGEHGSYRCGAERSARTAEIAGDAGVGCEADQCEIAGLEVLVGADDFVPAQRATGFAIEAALPHCWIERFVWHGLKRLDLLRANAGR